MAAALSGLAHTGAVAVAPVTETWSELNRRQQRVVSALGEVEKRVNNVAAKMRALGWVDPTKRGPLMEGAEWQALAQRQQKLLQAICAVKDRCLTVGHALGFTSAPHSESVAAPQLSRKIPSHFNNAQLRALLLEQPSASTGGAPMFPLKKLLVLVAVRDLQRFIQCGANRVDDSAAASGSAATASAAAASHAASSASAVASPALQLPADDLSSLSLEQLLQRFFLRACGVTLNAAQTTHLIREGAQLAQLSLQLDKESRTLLNEEPYILTAADSSTVVNNLAPSAALTASRAAFAAKQARSWFSSGISPFADYRFTRPPAGLSKASRVPCSQCHRPSSLYCPFCLLPTLPADLQIPAVRLPLQVDIIHHAGENVKKSTSIHACILSPSHCRFLSHPADLPADGYDPRTTVLLYPTPDAVFLDDPHIDILSLQRVLVIESTWAKSDIVASHPALSQLRRVKIRERESTFWRYQELGRHFLSTLEAIYFVCKEMQQRRDAVEAAQAGTSAASPSSASAPASSSSSSSSSSSGCIDDLMYFYAFQHSLIHERYKSNTNVPRSWSGGITAPTTSTTATNAPRDASDESTGDA